MKMAKIIGRITLSRGDISLSGKRLVIAAPFDKAAFADMEAFSGVSKYPNFIACDPLGAACGDTVGYVDGSEASAQFDFPIPVDACIVAIVEKLNYKPQ